MPRFLMISGARQTSESRTPLAPPANTTHAAAYELGRRAGHEDGFHRGRVLGQQTVESAMRVRLRAAIDEGLTTHEHVNTILLGRTGERTPTVTPTPSARCPAGASPAPSTHRRPPALPVVAAAPAEMLPLGAFTDGHLCAHLHPLCGLKGRITWTDERHGRCRNCETEITR